MGTKAAQTKSHTQKPLISITRLRPSVDAYARSIVMSADRPLITQQLRCDRTSLDAFSRFHFASGRRKSFFPPSRPILFKRQLSLFGASLQGSGNVTNGSEENEGIVLGHQKAPTLPEFSGFQINCIHHQRPSTD